MEIEGIFHSDRTDMMNSNSIKHWCEGTRLDLGKQLQLIDKRVCESHSHSYFASVNIWIIWLVNERNMHWLPCQTVG